MEQIGDFQREGPAGGEHETDTVWRKKEDQRLAGTHVENKKVNTGK